LGNKSYNLMGIIYLFICVMIVPEIIPELRKEYKSGKKAQCLKNIFLQEYVKIDTKLIRNSLSIV